MEWYVWLIAAVAAAAIAITILLFTRSDSPPEIPDPAYRTGDRTQREFRILSDRAREHIALIVVSVVAYEFYSARSLRKDLRGFCVDFGEIICQRFFHFSSCKVLRIRA